jgi:hypothetical protein
MELGMVFVALERRERKSLKRRMRKALLTRGEEITKNLVILIT